MSFQNQVRLLASIKSLGLGMILLLQVSCSEPTATSLDSLAPLEPSENSQAFDSSVTVEQSAFNKVNEFTSLAVSSKPKLGAIANYGEVYYYLGGSRGVILCFHGTNGSADGWTKTEKKVFLDQMAKFNFSFVCPTSLDRAKKQWNAQNSSDNSDIRNVEAILRALKVPVSMPLYLVGHSNGGGFVTRFAFYSSRSRYIRATQYSNSSGIQQILSHASYRVPALFNFSDCDPVVDANKVRQSAKILASKQSSVRSSLNDLDDVYAQGNHNHCHEFVNTALLSAVFFR